MNRRNVASGPAREPILVLLGDIDVFLQEFLGRAKLDAGRVVEFSPLVLASLHQLVENDSGNRSVRHSIP